MSKISIIIPVFNSGKYLNQCLDSACAQTLKDLEIICIDDGSSDQSLQILKDYSDRDHRIKLILHDKNLGLLKSWRDGIKLSQGEYIMFLDSDDELKENACEKLYSEIVKENVDIYQFGTDIITDTGMIDLEDSYRVFLRPYTKKLIGESVFEGLFYKRKYSWHVWNKIYSKNICKRFLDVTDDKYMILMVDVYASFFFTYFSKSSSGTNEKYYTYHVDRGYTGGEKVIKRIDDNYTFSWIIDELSSFLKNEGVYEKYKRILLEPPILPIESNMWLCRNIKDEKMRDEAVQKICDLWFDRYPEIVNKSKKRSFSKLYPIYHVLYYLKYNGLKKTVLRAIYRIFCKKDKYYSKV